MRLCILAALTNFTAAALLQQQVVAWQLLAVAAPPSPPPIILYSLHHALCAPPQLKRDGSAESYPLTSSVSFTSAISAS